MNFITAITLAAVAFQLAGHITYMKLVARDRVKPNATAWGLWAATSFLDALNYSDMTSGDPFKDALPWTCAISCIVTFFVCLFIGRIRFPEWHDLITVGFSSVALYVWKGLDKIAHANVIMQLDNITSFIPIIGSTWRKPDEEHPLAWGLWTLSYLFGTIVVLNRYTGQPVELLYPMLSVILHGLVFMLAIRCWKKTTMATA
jgi:hypothetical protein